MLSGLVLRDAFTSKTRDLDATGLFIPISRDPRPELFVGQLELSTEGYFKASSPSTRTGFAGVFGASDVVDHTAADSRCAGPGRNHLRVVTEEGCVRIGYIGRMRLAADVPRSSR